MRTQRTSCDVTSAVESRGTPYPHVVIVWATASTSLAKSSGMTRRLQQGTPVIMSFLNKDDAASAYDALLHHRAARLGEWSLSKGTEDHGRPPEHA